MVSFTRGRTLFRLAQRVEADGIPGALVDCGAWNGGSTVMLANGAPSREAWAFDSFEGLPEPGALDGARSTGYGGKNVGSEARVRAAFERYASPDKLHIVKGWFEDTFPRTHHRIGPVAILHCDGDWYESVKLTLETFYPQVAPGGYVVIDDYGSWEGAQVATDEYRETHRISEALGKSDRGGRYWRKAGGHLR